MSAPQIPGNRPYKKAGGAGLVPKADHKCNACGLCAEKCPAQAISRENPRETDGKKCISCMRCVSVCPQSARKVNSAMVSVAAMAIKKACSEKKSNELFLKGRRCGNCACLHLTSVVEIKCLRRFFLNTFLEV